jgi:hypothetical protein
MCGVSGGRSCRVRSCGSLGSLLLVLALTGASVAQERLGFFACGEVRFFGPACPPSPVPPEPSPPPAEAAPPEETPSEEPGPSAPLFTSETVAPATPPLVLRLLQEPTETNAQAFLAWQQARLQRMLEVQALLKRLQSEAGPQAPAVP